MNLPNKLTLARIAAVPAIVALMYAGGTACGLIAVALFLAASATDFLDGHIARSRGLVTDFGKLMDPIADKLLVTSVMIMMTELGLLPGWMLVLFVGREFAVSGLRLVAAGKGRVLAAGMSGKAKTVAQMIALTASLLMYYLGAPEDALRTAVLALNGVALALSLFSGGEYIWNNRDVISDM